MGPLLEVPIAVARDQAQREAADELAKAKYQTGLPPEVMEFLREINRRISEIFRQLFFNAGPVSVSGAGWVAIAILVLVILGVIALLIRRFGLPRFARRVHDTAVETDASMQPEDYRTLAEQAAANGDWRTAVQESFRAMVRELEVRTIIERRPARTAFETAALVARTWPELDSQLFQGATTFNEVIYGHRAAMRSDYETMGALEASVLERADQGYVEVGT